MLFKDIVWRSGASPEDKNPQGDKFVHIKALHGDEWIHITSLASEPEGVFNVYHDPDDSCGGQDPIQEWEQVDALTVMCILHTFCP